MRILVTGGRGYADAGRVVAVLEGIHRKRGIDVLIQGEAAGADKLARDWAEERGIPVIGMRANWRVHGNGAGPIRNGWMLKWAAPDAVVAFPGGDGTADMCRQAKAAGVPVWVLDDGRDEA